MHFIGIKFYETAFKFFQGFGPCFLALRFHLIFTEHSVQGVYNFESKQFIITNIG